MWQSDNVIFNINGEGVEKLIATLKLAVGKGTLAGWMFVKAKGLVLYSYIGSGNKDANKFPTPLTAESVAPMVFDWLKSEEAKGVPMEGWDADSDHDGSNELGWRVYTEDWGHVNGEWNAIAIKPAYMWYGK
jgi:hypothetical protein